MVDKALYNKRRELGLCPMCGNRRDDGWIFCSHCRSIARKAERKYRKSKNFNAYEHIKKQRARYKIEGRCHDCGKWELSSKTLCAKCRERHRESSVTYRINKILDTGNTQHETQ